MVRDFPGCKSVLEALSYVRTQRQDLTPVESIKDVGEVLRGAISRLSSLSSGFDYAKISLEERTRLARMSVESEAEIRLWEEAWTEAFSR